MSPQEIRDDETWEIEEVVAKEYQIAQELLDSEAPSFSYLGFIKRRNDFLTITQYEKEVENFDALRQRFDTTRILKALGIAANTLIALHTRKIVHDSPVLANTAYDTRTNQARTIDLSFSRHAQRSDASEYVHNITTYITSLRVAQDKYRAFRLTPEIIEEHLLDRYAKAATEIVPKAQLDKVRQALPNLIKH